MRTNNLYANASKFIFGADETPFLKCFIGKRGLQEDPRKVMAIVDWPFPRNQKDLRKWLGLSNYLHKYSYIYADMARPLSNLLKKDFKWCRTSTEAEDFKGVKRAYYMPRFWICQISIDLSVSSVTLQILPLAVLCYKQTDVEGRERVIAFEFRQLKAANRTVQFRIRSYWL